ncbi:hypothetical protein [Gottfriedia acidiceleris]|uniref:Uncharacterized protein n=1 Tax=Gottfriedia acidiceleris TaxID=371036 RepID=A0ABY4JR73_9BACI|nr:hypothetical protein [Gottfriedia acidiceleris]UPM54800.1 hypothetical protein MY490_02705 [Gottfriedia acidiceleris]
MKLGVLIVMSLTILFVEIEGFIKDKLHYHFQYEYVFYPIIGGVLVGLTIFIMQKINPSISNEKINGIISTCVLFFLIIIVPFLLF